MPVSELPLLPDAATIDATVELLEHIEGLPHGTTGVLAYGEDGVILLQNRRVCWAVAADMQRRLTDILCQQKEPPLARQEMEALFRCCKQNGTPIGEALVSSGLLSTGDLRSALTRHTGEAVGRIARLRTRPTEFTPHVKRGYDARFVFSAVELLSSLAAPRSRISEQARLHLGAILVPNASGVAFVRDAELRAPLVVAVDAACELLVSDVREMGSWSHQLFDVTSYFDQTTSIVSASWSGAVSIVTWRQREVWYVAICRTRLASTLLLSQLAKLLPARAVEQGSLVTSSGSPS